METFKGRCGKVLDDIAEIACHLKKDEPNIQKTCHEIEVACTLSGPKTVANWISNLFYCKDNPIVLFLNSFTRITDLEQAKVGMNLLIPTVELLQLLFASLNEYFAQFIYRLNRMKISSIEALEVFQIVRI